MDADSGGFQLLSANFTTAMCCTAPPSLLALDDLRASRTAAFSFFFLFFTLAEVFRARFRALSLESGLFLGAARGSSERMLAAPGLPGEVAKSLLLTFVPPAATVLRTGESAAAASTGVCVPLWLESSGEAVFPRIARCLQEQRVEAEVRQKEPNS